MASTSYAKQIPMPMKDPPAMNYFQYPAPQALYEDIVASPKVFMESLEKFHAFMGTKFMIPIIGGKELDLHRLFVEVTSRGGIEKIIKERRWKEVTAIFNFPSTATNASFVLRKYYLSLLYHYEQLYFFKARSWNPISTVPIQSPLMAQVPAQVPVQLSPEYQAAAAQQQGTYAAELSGARPASSATSPVNGVIDGKFDSGYLVTVTIGSEKLKGVLYQAPQSQSWQVSKQYGVSANNTGNAQAGSDTQRPRRRRRKKSEIKKRDPAHPKPNRSGYNFFFAEQHARLKKLYPGKDRQISRMIGELWNKLKESEKVVYQEKALKDKERYRREMEVYRERLKTGRVTSHAVLLQQQLPEHCLKTVETNATTEENEGEDSRKTPDNASSFGESDSEDDDKTAERDMDTQESPVEGLNNDSGNMDMETSAEAENVDPSEKEENAGDERVDGVGDVCMEH